MKPEDLLLFACTRLSFGDEHQEAFAAVCANHQIRWDVVCATARSHGVAPLLYRNFLRRPGLVPQDVLSEFKDAYVHGVAVKEQMARHLEEALERCGSLNIDVMLIKGVALDILVYDSPWDTLSQDIDLVLRAGSPSVSEELVRQTAESIYADIENVEADYFEHHDVTFNRTIPVDFKIIWGDAFRSIFRNHPVYLMSHEDMFIAICINSCRKRYFRLKSLLDIASIVERFYLTLNWQTVVTKASVYECSDIVYAALRATQQTVGCRVPPEVLSGLDVPMLRRTVIEFLVHRTSFVSLEDLYSGRKFLGRTLALSVLLPYSTYRQQQIVRRIGFLVRYSRDGVPRFRCVERLQRP
jgi:hypothetical protein